MDIQNGRFLSIEQLTDRYINSEKSTMQSKSPEGLSFKQILENKSLDGTQEPLKFSRHASVRLKDRGIELSDNQMERLHDGVKKAGQKGIKDSLVIVDELAFIVNIPNRTVVTAMNSTDTDEHVFTNINGAVIN